ncbi:transposase (plasmid) [Mesorhizobium japonicum MAFF 303099]|uniref:Transposase n=1 Tax=Mesorhizobium japonicum (strain LMG 29417 / CECT 9101 / MAFF 303099) TaxID=266835 RepID=Q98P99_RHILO|nr:transposase [Mesorhizobium japonicum MAFF 303099]
MHRPLAEHENLDSAMCRKEFRTLSQALTLRYDKVLFILDPSAFPKRLAGKKVVVSDYPDGRLEIMHGSTSLPYRTFDKLRSVHRSELVESKRLDEALAMVGRDAGWPRPSAQPTRPAPHRPGEPHVRHSRWQSEQWLFEARAQAAQTDRLHERSRRDCPARTGSGERRLSNLRSVQRRRWLRSPFHLGADRTANRVAVAEILRAAEAESALQRLRPAGNVPSRKSC